MLYTTARHQIAILALAVVAGLPVHAEESHQRPVLVPGSCANPEYPEASRKAGETGTVLLRFLVNETGDVVQSAIERSSGHPSLDEAAQLALQRCKFTPAMVDGKSASASTRLEYVWTLRERDPLKPPVLIAGSCKKPDYPRESIHENESGIVQLTFLVNEEGKAVMSKVGRSSGYQRLDEAARNALQTCAFHPAMLEGQATSAWITIEYIWALARNGEGTVDDPTMGGVLASRLPIRETPIPPRSPTVPKIRTSSCEKPPYPQASRRANEMGSVVLAFLIDEGGNVVDRKILRSSGYQRLDQAAAAGLSLCKFAPATAEGKPTRGWARMEYIFRLE